MLYETNGGKFWDAVKELYHSKANSWMIGLTYIRNYDHITSELGLEFNNNIIGRIEANHTISFKVIDERKFFLAKIKYGI